MIPSFVPPQHKDHIAERILDAHFILSYQIAVAPPLLRQVGIDRIFQSRRVPDEVLTV